MSTRYEKGAKVILNLHVIVMMILPEMDQGRILYFSLTC